MITTNDFCKKEYGQKLYKISFDAGFSCPNRDGNIDTRGCIFCSEGGSGDFAVKLYAPRNLSKGVATLTTSYRNTSKEIAVHNPSCMNTSWDIASQYPSRMSTSNDDSAQYPSYSYACSCEDTEAQIQLAKNKVRSKYAGDKFIAYFQAFTNTYADADTLRNIYLPIITRDDIAVLSIATRPDCIDDSIIALLKELNSIKPVWVELGLQTTKQTSIQFIRRGYDNKVYDSVIKKLNQIGIHTITHVILYLPGESLRDMTNTVKHVIKSGSQGIKFQLLHVLKGTDLADYYSGTGFPLPTLEKYCNTLKSLVELLPENMVVHRLTGDPPKRLLIAPLWAADKKNVLNTVNEYINPPQPYYVYMLLCGDGSYYTGSTNDVAARFARHASGKGCKYSASHLPVKLIYVEKCQSKRKALSREYAVKQLSHQQKKALVTSASNIVALFQTSSFSDKAD